MAEAYEWAWEWLHPGGRGYEWGWRLTTSFHIRYAADHPTLGRVPMADITEGIPDGVVRLVLRGQFVPYIAQLLATTLVAEGAVNLVEWDVQDPHGRGDFLLTIARKDGLSAMELKRQAEERLTEIRTRWYELLASIGPALSAYEADAGTLEHLLDTLHTALREATQPIGSEAQRILADLITLLRKDDFEETEPHLLVARVDQALKERQAARTLLDDPLVANALLRHAVLSELYAAYTAIRRINGNHKEEEDGDTAAEARS